MYLPYITSCYYSLIFRGHKIIKFICANKILMSNATPTKIFYKKLLRTHKAVVEILSLARVFSRGSNSNQPRQATLVRNHSVTQFFRTSRITEF
jgi:hypothetical protein